MIFITTFVALFVLVLCIFQLTSSSNNKIVLENKHRGSKSWFEPQPQSDPPIQGFTTSFSYKPGETVEFKIRCDPVPSSQKFYIDIYRMGYYQGKGGRRIDHMIVTTSICSSQPTCMFEMTTKMTDCDNWKVAATWKLPTISISGVYLAKLWTLNISEVALPSGYVPFVVRPGNKDHRSDILFKTSDTTWVAYNLYGGWNIYRGNGSQLFSSRATMASYNRPFANRLVYPIGQSQNFFYNTEYPMLYWLEQHGYDVAYASFADIEVMHHEKALIGKYKVLLSVGHDEYWTQAMRDIFTTARNHGTNIGFFSGNEIFWRIVWREDYSKILREKGKEGKLLNSNQSQLFQQSISAIHSGNKAITSKTKMKPFRVFVCRKESIDNIPAPHYSLWTGTYADPRHRLPLPENSLTGQLYIVNSYRNDSLVVPREEALLRFWRNSTLAKEALSAPQTWTYISPPGVLGYEWDILVDDVFRPPGLFTVSNTKVYISGCLMENFGASYKGSGFATHKLSLYRSMFKEHQLHDSSTSMEHICTVVSSLIKGNDSKASLRAAHPRVVSSLVFGAGTLQWSWALSDFRDGDYMKPDVNLQQATLNVLADMRVLPRSFNSSNGALVFPTISSDKDPPESKILQPVCNTSMIVKLQKHASEGANILKIFGTAVDRGGGQVAGVEVSVDGGFTWHMASGRSSWSYEYRFQIARGRHGFHDVAARGNSRDDFLSAEEIIRRRLMKERLLYHNHYHVSNSNHTKSAVSKPVNGQSSTMLIISRAVDDSGWQEPVDITSILCGLKSYKVMMQKKGAQIRHPSWCSSLQSNVVMIELSFV